ncbi:MAG: hypothetical protein K2X66_14360 [Cyanobacteria bacterium]|nr:hypothetical protein [Cyanobacteriota bacterium]
MKKFLQTLLGIGLLGVILSVSLPEAEARNGNDHNNNRNSGVFFGNNRGNDHNNGRYGGNQGHYGNNSRFNRNYYRRNRHHNRRNAKGFGIFINR